MPAQPTYTKTVRIEQSLYERLTVLGEDKNFSAYITRLVTEDVTSRELAIDLAKKN